MSTKESLIESESKDFDSKIITDIRVEKGTDDKNNYLEFKSDNEWQELCELSKINEKYNDINREFIINDTDLEEQYELLKHDVEEKYNEKYQMWLVDKKYNNNDMLTELKLEFRSNIKEDIEIYKIHNENGNIKEEINDSDWKNQKLRTMDIYVLLTNNINLNTNTILSDITIDTNMNTILNDDSNSDDSIKNKLFYDKYNTYNKKEEFLESINKTNTYVNYYLSHKNYNPDIDRLDYNSGRNRGKSYIEPSIGHKLANKLKRQKIVFKLAFLSLLPIIYPILVLIFQLNYYGSIYSLEKLFK